MLCDFSLSSWGKYPRYPMLCPGLDTKQLARNIFVKLTELNLSPESSTQEEVLTNKEAEQQLLEVIMLASIWRLFGSFFHFLANGIRGSAADNRLWHGDLNPGNLQKPWHSRATDIDQVRGWASSSHTELQKTKLLLLYLGKGPCSIEPRKRHICRVSLRKMYSTVLLPS